MAALARDRGPRGSLASTTATPTAARSPTASRGGPGGGVEVAGHAPLGPAGGRTAARRGGRRAAPDAVYLGGTLTHGGAACVALRRGSARVDVLLPDGFTGDRCSPTEARGAADGAYVASPGSPRSHFPAEGRRFVRAFATTLPGVEIEPTAIYGAAAADVVLDAIARSDGSRASVVDHLLATDAPATGTGPVRFDRSGDLGLAAGHDPGIEPARPRPQGVPRPSTPAGVVRPWSVGGPASPAAAGGA